jgi:hypothetical protein
LNSIGGALIHLSGKGEPEDSWMRVDGWEVLDSKFPSPLGVNGSRKLSIHSEMSFTLSTPTKEVIPLESSQIENRLRQCPRLPSLNSINSALRELLTADQRYTSQIAEVIRRDQLRLLRAVRADQQHRGSGLLSGYSPDPAVGHGHSGHRGFSEAGRSKSLQMA